MQNTTNANGAICVVEGKLENNGCKQLSEVQNDSRSHSDMTDFKKGREQYMNVRSIYLDQNIQPKFKSHTDYLVWKRMNVQLNSTS